MAPHRGLRPTSRKPNPLILIHNGLAAMAPLERPRIFISYAHRDGGDLAVRLQRDLSGGPSAGSAA